MRVAAVEGLPREAFYAQVFVELTPLARYLPAAFALHRPEVISELRVVLIVPVELHRVPDGETALLELRDFIVGEEEGVRRADLGLVPDLGRSVEERIFYDGLQVLW